MSPPRRLLLLLPAFAAFAAGGAPAQEADCAALLPNLPLDLDGDGAPDTVCVGDFDGDGSPEMDDVQDAVEALTDDGAKLVGVLAGDYAPPARPGDRPGRVRALLELESHTLLRCEPGALLRGPAGIGPDQGFAVIANRSHELGNESIEVRGCEIHGGAPDAFDRAESSFHGRMGVYFRRTRSSLVRDSHVHHTLHTGLYTSNSVGDQFLDNVVEDAGGFGATGPIQLRIRQPCIYAYAFGGGSVEDFVAARNVLRRCSANGLNTRAESENAERDVVRNVLWEDNLIETTGFATGGSGYGPGYVSKCMTIRGVDTITVRRNECRDSGGLHVNGGADWRDAGDDDASSNVVVDDLVVIDVNANSGVFVGPYSDGVSLRNVRVEHTRGADGVYLAIPCMRLEAPLRGALFEDLELRHCGREGLLGASLVPSGRTPDEALTFRRVTVEDVDLADPIGGSHAAGIHFRGAQSGLSMETITSDHASDAEIRFDRALASSTLRGIRVDSVDPGWLGAFAEADAPACDAAAEGRWLTTLDARDAGDCAFGPGTTGPASARCGCRDGAWSALGNARPGVVLIDGDAPSSHVLLEDWVVANARGRPGVQLEGDVTDFTVSGLLGVDDSPATDRPQRSALAVLDELTAVTIEGVECVDTEPAAPCVEYLRDAADWDGDGLLNEADNCPEHANPGQQDFDGDGAGDACDPDDDDDGLADVHETGTGVYVSPSDTGTDPFDPDSDDDGFRDGFEVAGGYDPNAPTPYSPTPALPVWALAAAFAALLAAARSLRRVA